MHPLWFFRVDAWVRDTLLVVRCYNSLLVDCFEMMLIMSRPITYNNLARILIRHDNAWNGQSATVSCWVIRCELFLHHTYMFRVSKLVCSRVHWHYFRRLIEVLVTGGMLPSSFLQRISNGNSFTIATKFLLDMWTGADFVLAEIDGRFIKLNWLEQLWLVNIPWLSVWIIGCLLQSFVLRANCSWLWSLHHCWFHH